MRLISRFMSNRINRLAVCSRTGVVEDIVPGSATPVPVETIGAEEMVEAAIVVAVHHVRAVVNELPPRVK